MAFLSKIKNSEFARNFATLMSGTVLAQLLPMLMSPIMTRIFNPADYGLLGLYMAISGMFNVVVTSQYNHAIMLPDKDDDSINIIGLCIVISLITGLVALIGVLLMGAYICDFFGIEIIGSWLYVIPLTVFTSGVYVALSYWTNRRCKYKRLAISRIAQSVIIIIVQVTFGLMYQGPTGLLLGLIIGQLSSTMILLYQVWRDDKEAFITNLSTQKIKKMAITHRSFALYLLPADFINALNNQVPTFLLTKFAGTSEAGKYNFTQRILGLPSAFISAALVDVFKQRAISDYNKLGNCRDIFVKTFKTLVLLGIVPLLVILFAAPDIFDFLFGSRWREAGVYAQILSVMIYLRFIISPLSYVYYIVGRQKEDLMLHIVMALGTAFSLYAGYLIYHSPKYMVLFFSINYSLIYLVYLLRSYGFAKGNVNAKTI